MDEKGLALPSFMSYFVDLSPDPFCITDNNGRLLRVNKRWEDSFGALKQKMEESLLTDDVHPDDKEKTASVLSMLSPDCSTSSLINRFRHQKSGYRWTEWRLLFHEGFISASARDINAHIESHEELQCFRDVLDSSLNEIYLAHADTFTFSFVSAGALANLGYRLEEMYAMTPFDINAPDQKKDLESLFKRLKGGDAKKLLFETEHYRKDGSAYPAEVYLQYISEGDRAFFLGVVLDVTEKRQWKKSLEESEERYRRLTEQALDIIYRIELIPERRFVYINPAVERITGYTPEEHYRDPDLGLKIVFEEDRPLLEAALKSNDIFSRPLRVRWKTKKKQIIWTEQHNVPLYDSEGKLIAIEGIARDVTDRMEMLEALNNEKKRLEVTLFSIGDAVIAADKQGRITLINPVAEHLLGVLRKDVLGSPVDDYVIIVDEETREPVTSPVTDVIQTCKAVELRPPCCLINSEGEQKLIESGAYPIKNEDGLLTGVVMIFRDISQKWAIQEHLIKTQRLESLGLLAARIAHDFNNLLSGLFGYVEIAAGAVRLGDRDKGLAYLEKAAGVYSRMKGLTGKFLTFSKGGGPVREKGDLSLLIREVLKNSLKEEKVSVEFRVDSDLQPCDFDEGQIRQVLTNIVLNAVEAMKGKGELKVEGSNLSVDTDSPLPLTPGPYIAVRISDNGEGIPSHYIKKIFDPFFTTKKNGSGLGLATGYSVVRQHGGDIQAESVLGEGTAVTVYLPASFGPVEKKNTDQEELFCGRGRALVLDDEEFVREVTAEMLQNFGFVVDEAEEGGRALRMIKAAAEKADSYSLIIADLTIPSGRGGKEIIDEIRVVDPDVAVVVSTGYSDDPVLNHPQNYGFSAGLHKPFTTEELSRVLKAVFLQEDGS